MIVLLNPWSTPSTKKPLPASLRLTGARRAALRALSAWRYRAHVYGLPLELRAVHRLWGCQRPETTGF